MRALEVCRDQWHANQLRTMQHAEAETRGVLLNPAMRREFDRAFGLSSYGVLRGLFLSPWPIRRRYASPELVEYWRRHGHITFEQWALGAGFRRKFLLEARRAGRA